jgi:hypothetical protein
VIIVGWETGAGSIIQRLDNASMHGPRQASSPLAKMTFVSS